MIDADRRRSPEQTLTAAIHLEAGLHPLRLTALLSVDAPKTELRWHLPDASESVVIPAEVSGSGMSTGAWVGLAAAAAVLAIAAANNDDEDTTVVTPTPPEG